MKPLVVYSLLRLGLFALVFAILMVAGADFWIAAIVAAVFGLAFSYLFLRRRRDALVRELQARRDPSIETDEDVEDR
ncbi:MAG: DUF4229 domain-containing protein [Microbacteriaceae bacterium]